MKLRAVDRAIDLMPKVSPFLRFQFLEYVARKYHFVHVKATMTGVRDECFSFAHLRG